MNEQIRNVLEKAIPAQVIVNGAAVAAVKVVEINWLTVLYVVLALMQIGWWSIKYWEKFRAKPGATIEED